MDKTTEDIIKGNKLIAGLFMIERLSDGKYFHINPELLLANKRWFLPEELKYHSSWDWQIPVWSKVAALSQKLAMTEELATRHNKLCDKYEEAVFQNNPEKGQQLIVEFIKFYNNGKN